MDNLEKNLTNKESIIKTNEDVGVESPTEVSSVGGKTTEEEINQKKVENNRKVEEARENVLKQFEGQESKQEFPEGHIMNQGMLDKIAQLEAIDPNTLEFSQMRYDDYLNSQSKLGKYTVGENQKILQKTIDKDEDLEDAYFDTEVIYGQGGWNRYAINPMDGMIALSRGSSNTTGTPEYKTKLAQKAKELGIKVEGQE